MSHLLFCQHCCFLEPFSLNSTRSFPHPSPATKWRARSTISSYTKTPHSTTMSRRRLLLTLSAAIPMSSLIPVQLLAQLEIDASRDPLYTRTASGLEYHDYRLGTGPFPVDGSTCTLRWTGRLADRFGWPFEQQGAPGDDPLRLVLGKDPIIEGLREGLITMRCGGKRRLLIPAKLGYTDNKVGPRPKRFGDRRRLYATVLNDRRVATSGDLVLDIELLKCTPPMD